MRTGPCLGVGTKDVSFAGFATTGEAASTHSAPRVNRERSLFGKREHCGTFGYLETEIWTLEATLFPLRHSLSFVRLQRRPHIRLR